MKDIDNEQLVSVICVFNNEQQLNSQLRETLNKQNCKYEFIPIDNRNNRYRSAAEALNYGARISKGDILVFAHQDIRFKTEDELTVFSKCIGKHISGAIFGASGAIENVKENIGNYTTGHNFEPTFNRKIAKTVQVSCVDEFLFGMKRITFEKHNFDEKLCNDWHLYAVEQCLFHRKKGDAVYVVPINVHHFSRGQINNNYFVGLLKLSNYYRKDFEYIWTTCYKVRTSFLYVRTLYVIWYLHRKVRRKDL